MVSFTKGGEEIIEDGGEGSEGFDEEEDSGLVVFEA
jgi:hypothetical protein